MSPDWLDIFPDCSQRTLAHQISYHCPDLLESGMEDWGGPFRFEIMRLDEKNISPCVKDWWGEIKASG